MRFRCLKPFRRPPLLCCAHAWGHPDRMLEAHKTALLDFDRVISEQAADTPASIAAFYKVRQASWLFEIERIRELNSELAQSLLKYFRQSELADNYLVRGFKISTDLDGKWSKQFPIYEVASETMRFSWTGLMLAPLLVPLMFCAVVSPLLTNGWVPLAFLVLLVPSCVVSYGTTIFLFLPSLFLLSLWRPMTGLKVCLLGLVLGAVAVAQ